MDEVSREGQKVSTHRGRVLIDVAAHHRHSSTVDEEATSILPNKKGSVTSMGRWKGHGGCLVQARTPP